MAPQDFSARMQWGCSWRLCACSFYKLFCDDWHMFYITVAIIFQKTLSMKEWYLHPV